MSHYGGRRSGGYRGRRPYCSDGNHRGGGRGHKHRGGMSRPESAGSAEGSDQGQGHWRGNRNRHNWQDRRDNDQFGDDYKEHRPRGGGRKPHGALRGRDIGMFYANKGKQRQKEQEMQNRPEVNFDGRQEQNIRRLLHDIQSTRDCPLQPSRSYADPLDHSENVTDMGPSGEHHKIEEGATSDRAGQYDPWSDSNKRGIEQEPAEAGYSGNFDKTISGQRFESLVEPSAEMLDQDDNIDDDYDDDNDVKMEDVSGIIDAMQEMAEEDYLGNVKQVTLPQQSERIDTNHLDEELYNDFMNKQNNRNYQDMMKFRQRLPSYDHKQRILDVINDNQVVVLSGETGCGKTTQVPQFILDDMIQKKQASQCRIICTQPRRISAISVAERVAAERAETCGKSTGYLIRLENKLPRAAGSILYCTTGILLKVLEEDPLLEKATHIILDEIHERDLLSDFLIIILRDVLAKRPDLKVILMSATLNAEAFSEYYNNCPMYNIPGFTYPVKEYYLEDAIEELQYRIPDKMQRRRDMRGYRGRNKHKQDQSQQLEEIDSWIQGLKNGEYTNIRYSNTTYDALRCMDMDKIDLDLIKDLIKHIVTTKEEGAILVFVPGWMEIKNLHQLLTGDSFFSRGYFKIIPLHSMMPTVNQKEVFERPERGVKIVIATNIAETSITIDDIIYVIDSGRIKVKGYSPENNLSSLTSQLVSLANARQRRGRAGRVQAGECYHLYTRLQESNMLDYLPPEMLRTRLEELCLQIKYLKLGSIVPFVSKAIQPPAMEALNSAIVNLQRLNALDNEENLLPLGKHLARMPLDPHTGKMILFAAMFGCLDPVLTIAAGLNFKDPFFTPLGKEKLVDQRKKSLSDECFSDHLLLVKTFNQWERAVARGTNRDFCYRNFLSESTLRMLQKMKTQLAGILQELGFLRGSSPKQTQANQNSGNEELVKAIICAGLYPNIAKVTKGKTKFKNIRFLTEDNSKCELHPKSVANDLPDPMGQWVVYHMKMKTACVYIYDLSVVSPYALLFFGGGISQMQDEGIQTVCVDDWIRFKASQSVVSLVKELRIEMDLILDNKISDTKTIDWESHEGAVIRAIIDLITKQDNIRSASQTKQWSRKERRW